jgi:hypothetical protein
MFGSARRALGGIWRGNFIIDSAARVKRAVIEAHSRALIAPSESFSTEIKLFIVRHTEKPRANLG